MINKWRAIMSRSLRTILMITVIVFIQSSTFVYESKVENENVNKNVNLSTMALKIDEIEENRLYSAIDTYTGDLTGYVFNCPLCGGTLACAPDYYIKDGKDYYDDPVYGRVKIVASSRNLSCGTIVRFNSSRISDKPVIAIVLDRGVTGNSLDLLAPNLEYATKNIGRSSITYDVLRQGWE